MGHCLRGGLQVELLPRRPGHSDEVVFPVPVMSVGFVRAWGEELGIREELWGVCRSWANLLVTALNVLHAGRGCLGTRQPTAAQKRVQRVQLDTARCFFGEGFPWPEEAEVTEQSRRHLDYDADPNGGRVLELSDRGGIPPRAGLVNLETVLDGEAPQAVAQLRDPTLLLLPVAKRPVTLKRPFVRVARDYVQFVHRCVDAGLMGCVKPDQVWTHGSKKLYAGAFAVAKKDDPNEDRVIMAAVPRNQLFDRARLIRPRFAYPPKLRAMRTRRGVRMLKTKRDARHYFFQLRLPKVWRKFLAWPPVKDAGGDSLYPRATCAPMGFARRPDGHSW